MRTEHCLTNDRSTDTPASRLAIEALTEGIGSGFGTRCANAWKNPEVTIGQAALAGIGGLALGRFAHTSLGKIGLTLAGISCAVDLGRRLYMTGQNVSEVYNHPDSFYEKKRAIAETLGGPLFDYTVMAAPGIAGLYVGAKFMRPVNPLANGGISGKSELSTVAEPHTKPVAAGTPPTVSEVSIPTYSEISSGRRVQTVLSSPDAPLGRLYLENSPSVVHVRIGRSSDGMGQGYPVGSGFFVNKKGLVATNDHVIAGHDILAIETQDGIIIPARLVARDAVADLALIEPVGTILHSRPLELASQSLVEWGKPLTVLGHPGFESQVVMAQGRSLGFYMMEGRSAVKSGAKEPLFTAVIGSDVPSTHGFSGGPMLENGKVIGVLRGELGGTDGLIGATDVQHLKLLIHELTSARPLRGHLELQSTFQAGFNVFGPKPHQISVKTTWPINDTINYYNLKELDFVMHPWLKPKTQ